MRRAFAGSLLVAAVVLAAPAGAQRPATGSVVGILWTGTPEATGRLIGHFRDGLTEQGLVEGRDVALEQRWARNDTATLPHLAADLVRAGVDVIVAQGTPAGLAAKRTTSTIPIVLSSSGDPVAAGLVDSLARPGGNVTGLTNMLAEVGTKRLELLREILPHARDVTILADSSNAVAGRSIIGLAETLAAARALGLRPTTVEIAVLDGLDTAFETAARSGAEAVVVMASPLFVQNARRFVDLAARHRLPAVYQLSRFTRDGGLVSYGEIDGHNLRRSAAYVARILRGARPADLPVEQAARFELVVNLRAARALGITVPDTVVLRADEVIE